MKKLLTTLCLVLLVSCSNEVPEENLVERQGVAYKINSTKPFTGIKVSESTSREGVISTRKEKYKKGLKEGLYEEVYYKNGQLEYKLNFNKNGYEEGLQEHYYENGQLSYRVNYKNGYEEGLSEYFDEEGNLTKTEEYKDGELILSSELNE